MFLLKMDMLLQCVEESEDVGYVGRPIAMWRSAKWSKGKQSSCTARDHNTGSAQCPKRIKEVKVNKIRTEKGLSYTEAEKSLERNDEREAVLKEQVHGADQNICMEKKQFLVFIAMVINCVVARDTREVGKDQDGAGHCQDILERCGRIWRRSRYYTEGRICTNSDNCVWVVKQTKS